MTTTIVAGRRASLRTNWRPPADSSSDQPMASPLDKFPAFEESPVSTTNDPNSHLSPQDVRYTPEEYWQPRKNGHISWDRPNGAPPPSKHRPRKSISEAITTIKTRNASVSVNAHELADALKAPISYRLIVRLTNLRIYSFSAVRIWWLTTPPL